MNTLVLDSTTAKLSLEHLLTQLGSGGVEVRDALGNIVAVVQLGTTEFHLELGWSGKQNVSGETRESVSGIAYDGHDFVWEWTEDNVDRNATVIGKKIKSVFVNQVSPRTDLSVIGIEP